MIVTQEKKHKKSSVQKYDGRIHHFVMYNSHFFSFYNTLVLNLENALYKNVYLSLYL